MVHLEHNIVSLLYSIKSLIESHLDHADEGRFKETRMRLTHAEEVLKRAFRQTNRALKVTRKLAGIHKNGNGNSNGHVSTCFRKSWADVKALLKKSTSFDRIELIERIPDDYPEVVCQPNHLKEILYELTRNALQAMGADGKIALRAQMSVSQKEEPHAVITLSDTGPGISKNQLPYLFHPFFTTKPEGKGNGLGLYLVKQLVEKNHGRISVSSFEGCGTTFTLEFPRAKHPSNKPLTAP